MQKVAQSIWYCQRKTDKKVSPDLQMSLLLSSFVFREGGEGGKRKAIKCMAIGGQSKIPKLNETNGDKGKFVSYANYVNLPKKLKYFYCVNRLAQLLLLLSCCLCCCCCCSVVVFHLSDARRRLLRNVKDESVNAD